MKTGLGMKLFMKLRRDEINSRNGSPQDSNKPFLDNSFR
jgi:hypothetical protein